MDAVVGFVTLAVVTAGLLGVIQWSWYQNRTHLALGIEQRWGLRDQLPPAAVVAVVTEMTSQVRDQLHLSRLSLYVSLLGLLSGGYGFTRAAMVTAPLVTVDAGARVGLLVMGVALVTIIALRWLRVEATVQTTIQQLQTRSTDQTAATMTAAVQVVECARQSRGWRRRRTLLATQVVLWACADALLKAKSSTSRPYTLG